VYHYHPIANKVQEDLRGKGPYPLRTFVEAHRLNRDDIPEVEGTFPEANVVKSSIPATQSSSLKGPQKKALLTAVSGSGV
jgi:hypothetical protein